MFSNEDLRETLSAEVIEPADAERVLATVAAMINDVSTHDQGRDFLIRVLGKKGLFPSYHTELIDDLVRSAGLLPYASQPKNLIDAVLFEAHAVPNLEQGWVFHSLQLQVFRLLMNGKNVVLSATTSVGKSLIVDAVIGSGRFKKIVVIVPTIALIDETRRRIANTFGQSHTIITHPSQTAPDDRPSVYLLTQERVLARNDLGDVDFFVVDEFYKLDLERADTRAVDLNLAFYRLAKTGAQFYLIGPNISEVRGIASRFQHVFVPSSFSTVALDIEYFNLGQHSQERDTKLVELVRDLESPTLIYCQSPSKCGEVATLLRDELDYPEVEQTGEAVDWLLTEFPAEWVVIEALRRGIGIHHGNVPRALQHYMVRCFEDGTIRLLICTSTIIEGVNTVAENVIVYDRRLRTSTIDSFTFRNIAGRAGRMGEWFVGKVFVLEAPIDDIEKTVTLPVEDQDENTPMSLLLDLSPSDLSDISSNRIEEAILESSLSLETLKTNRHISIDAQRSIAEKIRSDLYYREALNWRGMPDGKGLTAACELIYDFIDEGRTLKSYQIFSGQQLAARLASVGASTMKRFIAERVSHRRETQSVSDAVETTLKFLRSYVVYTFPRQLMAIDAVFRDVAKKSRFEASVDYSLYAGRAENLFLQSGLFALDEYGVPPQTAYRLGLRNPGIDSLDKALHLISSLDLAEGDFHPFEASLLDELQVSLRPAPLS